MEKIINVAHHIKRETPTTIYIVGGKISTSISLQEYIMSTSKKQRHDIGIGLATTTYNYTKESKLLVEKCARVHLLIETRTKKPRNKPSSLPI